MVNQKLDEVMELLNKVRKRQDKYEKDYFKKDHDTASCNCFAGEKEKMEQHQEHMKLSTIIDSIKVEVGQLTEMVEKQEQYLDDLEQYGRSNCLILHGNNIDHRINSMDVEKYVLNILNIVKLTNAQLPIFYCLMRRSFLINKQKKEKKKITSGFSLFLLKVSVSK